jgi:hypothetical protein
MATRTRICRSRSAATKGNLLRCLPTAPHRPAGSTRLRQESSGPILVTSTTASPIAAIEGQVKTGLFFFYHYTPSHQRWGIVISSKMGQF